MEIIAEHHGQQGALGNNIYSVGGGGARGSNKTIVAAVIATSGPFGLATASVTAVTAVSLAANGLPSVVTAAAALTA